MMATYEFPRTAWSVSAGVTNLTDEIYMVSGVFNGGIGYTQATVNRPREWGFSAKYRF